MIYPRKLPRLIAPRTPHCPVPKTPADGRPPREERKEKREKRRENFPLSSFLFPLSSLPPRTPAPPHPCPPAPPHPCPPAPLLLYSPAPLLLCLLLLPTPAIALPPPEDLPEEILRTDIITEARSPIDGQPITPAEYAQLQLQQPELWTNNPNLPTETQAFSATSHIINKYPIRDLLRQMFPF